MRHLPHDAPAREAEEREDQDDHGQHRGDLPDPPLEPDDRRRQDESEENGEENGHQDVLCPIKDGDDQDDAREGDPGGQAGRSSFIAPYLSKARA